METFPIDLEAVNPLELTTAIFGSELPQVTEFVTSLVLRLVKVPVAFSCVVVPKGMDIEDGSTAMDTMTAEETPRFVVPLKAWTFAITEVFPTESDVARPAELILATAPLLLVQTADWVSSCEEPSLHIPAREDQAE
jgi:hypothetical protein